MEPELRLKELGLALLEPAKPVASYIPTLIVSNLLFTSGNLPMKDGKVNLESLLQNLKYTSY